MEKIVGNLPEASRSQRMLKLLEPNNNKGLPGNVVEKRKEKRKEDCCKPSYIDLFDRGRWEELNNCLMKDPFDKNIKKRQPWGKENMRHKYVTTSTATYSTSQGYGDLLVGQQLQRSHVVASQSSNTPKDMVYCTTSNSPNSYTPNVTFASNDTALTTEGHGELLSTQQLQSSHVVASQSSNTPNDMVYCTASNSPNSYTPNVTFASNDTALTTEGHGELLSTQQLQSSHVVASLSSNTPNDMVYCTASNSPNSYTPNVTFTSNDKSLTTEGHGELLGTQQLQSSHVVASQSSNTPKDMVYCTTSNSLITPNFVTSKTTFTSNDTACITEGHGELLVAQQLQSGHVETSISVDTPKNMANNTVKTISINSDCNSSFLTSNSSSKIKNINSRKRLFGSDCLPRDKNESHEAKYNKKVFETSSKLTCKYFDNNTSKIITSNSNLEFDSSNNMPNSSAINTRKNSFKHLSDNRCSITDQDDIPVVFLDQLQTSNVEMDPSIESLVNMPNNSIVTMVIPVSPYLSNTNSSPESISSTNKKNYSKENFNDTNFSSVIPVNFLDVEQDELSDEECFKINTQTSQPMKKKRKWDRKNYCLCCEKLITNFSKHMKNMHSNQEPVMKYCAILDSDLKVRKRRRQAIFDELRKQGNFQYNQKVLRESFTPPTQSMLLPVKRSHKDDISSAILCKVCLGMYARKSFYKHADHCGKKDTDEEEILPIKNPAIKHQGLELNPCSDQASEILKTKIIPLLRKDKKGIAAITDPLITSVASDFLCNHSSNKDKYNITSKMRDAGGLLLKMKEKDSTIISFIDCFDVKQLDNMISAVQEMSGSNLDTGTVDIIGMPARLSWVIHECCSKIIDNIISDQSFTENHKDTLKRNIMDFQTVIRRRWKYAISTNAEKTRKKNAMKKDVVMPVDSDIKLLMEELTRLEQEYSKRLRFSITINNYEHLCEVIVGKLIVLNRRRSGEVANAELQFYIERPKGTISEEILNQLSDDEKTTLNMFEVFLIPGKIVRAVPILFSKSTAQNIDLLISCRTKLGIPQHNKFLFARPGTENPFIGANIIRKFRKSLQLQKPEHMTATGLRHHCATMAHVHGKSLDKEDLAEFMGHTLEVHKRKYRYPLEVIQRGKIAPHLMKLGGVNLNDLEKQNEVSHKDTEGEDDPDYVPESPEENLIHAEEPVAKRKTKKRWTEDEKIVVIENFKDLIKNRQNPGTRLCKELILTQPLLEGRTWMQVNLLIDNYNKGKIALPLQYRYLRDW